MSVPPVLSALRLPVMAAPMFIVSGVELVMAQCRAGVVGSFPSLNARPASQLDEWLTRLKEEIPAGAAPFAVNLIVHRSNPRLEEDLALLEKHRAPLVISSLGAREEVNQAVHSWGGIVLHDVIDDRFARKAIEKGADGLVAVAAGAGGHAGSLSPFALVQEIRAWFDGPLALSGAIANGRSILAVRALGADFAYVGSPFIATEEANAVAAYKQMVVDHSARDIVTSSLFTGVSGNYLAPSIAAQGLDPTALASADASAMDFANLSKGKAWKDIWGCGQGIGAVHAIVSVADLVTRLESEYRGALAALGDFQPAP